MPTYAVIEVGTNSIKFLIQQHDQPGRWITVFETVEICRLGEGISASGRLRPEAMARNVAVLSKLRQIAQEHQVAGITAIGTMGLRTAANAPEFVQRVEQTCGLTLDIITGEEEAWLAYLAVQSGPSRCAGRTLVIDIGGGSTECILGIGPRVQQRVSLNVGAIRYTEQFLRSDPATHAECARAIAAIDRDLATLTGISPLDALIGIGGGLTTLSAVAQRLAAYDRAAIEGFTLTRAEIDRQIASCRTKTIEERKTIVGLQPKRADVILAGALIVARLLRKFDKETLRVSARGVRHGLMQDRFSETANARK